MLLKLTVIALGGALGTLLRYAAGGFIYRFTGGTFPWGTLGINLAGSFVIGSLWAMFETLTVSPNVRAFALIGILGGFTTFSTFTLETFNLLRDGEVLFALVNVLVSTLSGVLLVFAGFILSRSMLSMVR